MDSIIATIPQSGTAHHDPVRRRLFAWLAERGNSVDEIVTVSRVDRGDLADWMVGLYQHNDDLCCAIDLTLRRIAAADGGLPA